MVRVCAVLRGCVARRRAGLDRYYLDPAIVPLIVPIWHWLNNRRKRVEKLLAKLATGVRLPRRFGWLVGMSQETGAYGEQLQYLLSEPEAVSSANGALARDGGFHPPPVAFQLAKPPVGAFATSALRSRQVGKFFASFFQKRSACLMLYELKAASVRLHRVHRTARYVQVVWQLPARFG